MQARDWLDVADELERMLDAMREASPEGAPVMASALADRVVMLVELLRREFRGQLN